MEEVVRYKAIDGIEFENKEDCLIYESKFIKEQFHFKLLDACHEEIDITSDPKKGFLRCMYMRIEDNNDYNYLSKLYEKTFSEDNKLFKDVIPPPYSGIFYYHFDGKWYSLNNKIDDLKDELHDFEQARHTLLFS